MLNAMGVVASYTVGAAPVLVMVPETRAPQLVGAALYPAPVVLPYSPAIALNASLGAEFLVTATDAVAFAIGAPTAGRAGQLLDVTIINGTAGALGVLTWNAAFNLGAAWVEPAAGLQRTIRFRLNGAVWDEIGRTAADV